jgi:outer membrane protein assembly factor BamB
MPMNTFRRFGLIAILALLHAVVTIACLLYAMSDGMARFDNPDLPHTVTSRVIDGSASVLMLPARMIWTSWANQNLPDAAEFLLFAANSVLWGAAGVVLLNWSVRRRLPHRAVAFFFVLAAASSWASVPAAQSGQTPGASSPEWPGWGGPNRNFVTSAPALATSWPAGGPPKLWSRPLGEGHSSIAVDGGRLYTMYRPASGARGRFAEEEVTVALDAATGKTLWEHRFPSSLETMNFSRGAGPHATPLIVGDRVFTAASDKQLFALDKQTGRVIWSHHFVKAFGAPPNQMRYAIMPGYAPSPIAYRDTVIAMVGGANQGVMAFRQDTGSVIWKSGNFPDDISPASPMLITLDGEDQLVVTSGDGVHGMAPADGRKLWSFPFPTRSGVNNTTPVWSPSDRTLFLSAAYDGGTRLLELARAGGRTEVKERWFSNRMRVHFSNIVRVGDHFFGSSGDFGPSFLTAIDARNGNIAWQDRTFSKASFLDLGGRVLLLDEDGTLALATLGPDKLTVLAQAEMAEATSWTVPTLVGTTLYLRDRVNIMALDLGTRNDER